MANLLDIFHKYKLRYKVLADQDYSYNIATWIKRNYLEPTYLDEENFIKKSIL